MEAAKAPFVAIAATAPAQTTTGWWKFAAMVAAVICPTSPHSEKKIAAKDTMAAREARSSFWLASRFTGFRHTVIARPMKLMLVSVATNSGGSFDIAFPTATATAILAMNATSMPIIIGTVRYRV